MLLWLVVSCVSLQPHGLQLTRLLCPWDSTGKNTGVGHYALLEGIFPTQGSYPGFLHCKWILYQLSYQGSPGLGIMPYYLATSCKELTHWKRPWCWERLGAGGEGDDRGWDGWMASPTRWAWVWVNSGSSWWTGRPGVLQFTGSQRVGHNWATELNWTDSHGKESACNMVDLGLISGSGRSPGGEHGNPLQYSCLENPMDRGAWQATAHGVAKRQTWLSNYTTLHYYFTNRVNSHIWSLKVSKRKATLVWAEF